MVPATAFSPSAAGRPACAEMASTMSWAPARTCPCRSAALRHSVKSGMSSSATTTATPSRPGRKGCVTAR